MRRCGDLTVNSGVQRIRREIQAVGPDGRAVLSDLHLGEERGIAERFQHRAADRVGEVHLTFGSVIEAYEQAEVRAGFGVDNSFERLGPLAGFWVLLRDWRCSVERRDFVQRLARFGMLPVFVQLGAMFDDPLDEQGRRAAR